MWPTGLMELRSQPTNQSRRPHPHANILALAVTLTGAATPNGSTLRRLFAHLDADAFDDAFDTALGLWFWTRIFVAGARRRPDTAPASGGRARPGRCDRARVALCTGQEKRNPLHKNTVGEARPRRCIRDDGCDAHPDRHCDPRHRCGWRPCVHPQGQHAHPARRIEGVAVARTYPPAEAKVRDRGRAIEVVAAWRGSSLRAPLRRSRWP